MPRLPKNFKIEWVSVDELTPGGYVSTGRDTAVPTHFQASFVLSEPDVTMQMEVMVGADRRPLVIEATVRGKTKAPITTSVMRQVLIDQLLRAAMVEATVPASVRERWLASLPPGVQPVDRREAEPVPSADQRFRSQADHDAQMAAQIYSDAVASGDRAPGIAVAHAMNRSRTQVSRYLRRARDLGLLPPLGPSEGA
ncbi:hypothetical protein ACTG9Q_28760 [Actinokineospora sp. 24-640]